MNTQSLIRQFNNPDTLGIISSYPAHSREVARGNAISRYVYLLVNNLPRGQKVVIFCEIGKTKKTYLEAPNILVVPTYKPNSLTFLKDILQKVLGFDAIDNIMIQFEFSIFGGKIIIPQIALLLLALKFLGKSTKIAFHQVVADIGTLSGHLAIEKNGIKTKLLNFLLRIFYESCGVLSEKVFVHDQVLARRLSDFVDSGKIRIIPHAITEEKRIDKDFAAASKKYFGVRAGTKVVTIFGYCSWYKGTDWLIENFAKFAKKNPPRKIKLLVAGGESPTLKGTMAYQKYHAKLQRVIKEANGSIIYTGYIPEKDVRKVFAATDLFVFPYRTKMSASGAFSLCQGFGKPYLVSKAFSENIGKSESNGCVFSLNHQSFIGSLDKKLSAKSYQLSRIEGRNWRETSLLYLKENLPETSIEPKLNYAEAF